MFSDREQGSNRDPSGILGGKKERKGRISSRQLLKLLRGLEFWNLPGLLPLSPSTHRQVLVEVDHIAGVVVPVQSENRMCRVFDKSD